jgi:hypothetical protein
MSWERAKQRATTSHASHDELSGLSRGTSFLEPGEGCTEQAATGWTSSEPRRAVDDEHELRTMSQVELRDYIALKGHRRSGRMRWATTARTSPATQRRSEPRTSQAS